MREREVTGSWGNCGCFERRCFSEGIFGELEEDNEGEKVIGLERISWSLGCYGEGFWCQGREQIGLVVELHRRGVSQVWSIVFFFRVFFIITVLHHFSQAT